MIAVTSQAPSSGRRCGEMLSAAAAVASAGTKERTEGRLDADLEGTQLLHFACHCCNSINILVCSKTPDGSWLLRRAASSAVAAASDVASSPYKDIELSLSSSPPDALRSGSTTPPYEDALGSESEAPAAAPASPLSRPATDQQDVSPRFTILLEAVCDNSTDASSLDSGSARQLSGCSGASGDQAGGEPAANETTTTAETPAAVCPMPGGAVAIAAPTPKRLSPKASSTLRSLATNSTASTCSSLWEAHDLTKADEASSPSEAATSLRNTPKSSWQSRAAGQQQRQQVTSREAKQVQQTETVSTHQLSKNTKEPEVCESAAARNSTEQPSHTEAFEEAEETVTDESRVAQQGAGSSRSRGSSNMGSSSSNSRGCSEKPDSENSPVAASSAQPSSSWQVQQPQPTQLAEQLQNKQPQQWLEGSCRASSSRTGSSSNSSSSGSSSRSDSKELAAQMAAHMVARECEGDGNCLYRAFSDQLYGSQRHHLFLRKLAVDVMQRCQATFEAFVDDSEGPFERWLQTKRIYGEWADYREMHALMLLFGTPIFVFDEKMQLLQAFEPDEEKRRPPGPGGETLVPFRLMWHGKLGHYTSGTLRILAPGSGLRSKGGGCITRNSKAAVVFTMRRLCVQRDRGSELHYIKEGFPIARGLTIGDLESEGLARLILSLASEDSLGDGASLAGPPEGSSKKPSPTSGIEDEALAECLQVSAQELAHLAAEQELILSAIKRQRLQQLLPQTTKIVDALWQEAIKEQKAWTARLAGDPRSLASSVPAAVADSRRRERQPAAAAAPGDFTASVVASETGYQASKGPLTGERPSASSAVKCVVGKAPPSRDLTNVVAWEGQTRRYAATHQQVQKQHPPIVSLARGPQNPTMAPSQSSEGGQQGTPDVRGGYLLRPQYSGSQQYVSHPQFVQQQQQQQIFRLSDGRLICVSSDAVTGPLRPATLQQRQGTEGTASFQRSGSSIRHQPDDANWLSRWMGGRGSSSSQDR